MGAAALGQGLKTPELAVTDAEATNFAGPGLALAAYYGVEPDPLTMAWAAFLMAGAQLIVPRVILIRQRLAAEADAAPERPKPKLVHVSPPPMGHNGGPALAPEVAAPAPTKNEPPPATSFVDDGTFESGEVEGSL